MGVETGEVVLLQGPNDTWMQSGPHGFIDGRNWFDGLVRDNLNAEFTRRFEGRYILVYVCVPHALLSLYHLRQP